MKPRPWTDVATVGLLLVGILFCTLLDAHAIGYPMIGVALLLRVALGWGSRE